MSKKAQGGSGVIGLVVIVIIGAIVAYLYFGGYISFPNSSTTYQPSSMPITITASSPSASNLSNLYPGQSFNALATVRGTGVSPVNISIIGYGCGGTTQATKYVEVYPNASVSSSWTFSAPGTGSCDIQFTSCFNDMAYSNYPITVENETVTSQAPVDLPSSSIAPVSISLSGFSSTVNAPPSSVNQTFYVQASALSAGYLKNSALNWLNIAVVGSAFVQLPKGIESVGRSINITNKTATGILYFSGVFRLPLELTFEPVPQASGFTTSTDVNISAGYTYCLTSNLLPVSVS